MKANALRLLGLAALATASLAASGSLFADESHHGNYGQYQRYEHGRHGWHRGGVAAPYWVYPRVIERPVVYARPVYVPPPVVYYPPPPSPTMGQAIGGAIGVVIDQNQRHYYR